MKRCEDVGPWAGKATDRRYVAADGWMAYRRPPRSGKRSGPSRRGRRSGCSKPRSTRREPGLCRELMVEAADSPGRGQLGLSRCQGRPTRRRGRLRRRGRGRLSSRQGRGRQRILGRRGPGGLVTFTHFARRADRICLADGGCGRSWRGAAGRPGPTIGPGRPGYKWAEHATDQGHRRRNEPGRAARQVRGYQ